MSKREYILRYLTIIFYFHNFTLLDENQCPTGFTLC